MITFSIEITPPEKSRLIAYCESVNDSGHWGDGAVELPDEKILADRIRSADAVLELSLRDADILIIHIEEATDHGFVLLPEDQSLLLKLVEVLESARRFPGRIIAIYIRNAGNERAGSPRLAAAFRDLGTLRCVLFGTPEEIRGESGLFH
jgi:hypothetical protein